MKYEDFNKTDFPVVKSAVGVVLEKNGKILITKRAHELKFEPDKWCLPGGHIDIGETAVEAAKRELKEETGFIVKELTYFNYYDEFLPKIKNHSLSLFFHATKFSGEPNKNSEVSEQKWISKEDIPKFEFAFLHKKIVEDFYSRK